MRRWPEPAKTALHAQVIGISQFDLPWYKHGASNARLYTPVDLFDQFIGRRDTLYPYQPEALTGATSSD